MWRASREKEPRFICIFPSRKRERGFTLVEMMVVITLVVIIASLAVSVALRARVQSNEAATAGNLRTISSAAEAFRGTQNPPAYPASFVVMATSNPPYLDSAWTTSNQRQGYVYNYAVAGNGDTFSTTANPRNQNTSGINTYCVDHTGVIRRYAGGGNAGGQDGCNANGTPI